MMQVSRGMFLGLLVLASLLAGCKGDPRVRVRNLASGKVNTDFGPTSGSTLHIQNVDAGTTSAYLDLPETTYRVHVSVSGKTSPEDVNLVAQRGNSYLVTVSAADPPVLTVTQE